MIYYLITFSNTHSAITAESHLKPLAKITMMPTLREISASCGISIRFSKEDYETVLSGLESLDLDKKMFALYEIIEKDGKIFPSLV